MFRTLIHPKKVSDTNVKEWSCGSKESLARDAAFVTAVKLA